MRCKYCGSTNLHPKTEHKTFSTGKAIAGAVTFGPVGAVGGFIGKDTKGYECGVCGAFMEAPMDLSTELGIDGAIRDAEAGRDRSLYDYYKRQYTGIMANIPASAPAALTASIVQQTVLPKVVDAGSISSAKRSFRCLDWQPECPVFVESVIIKSTADGDVLSLVAWNQSEKRIRSAYYKATVFDDTGDKINEVQCVYQGLDLAPGEMFPIEKEFRLNTDLAYKVELVCEKVALSDDSVWRNSSDTETIILSDQMILTQESFPRFKYIAPKLGDFCQLGKDDELYLPYQGEGYWQCICGNPVRENRACFRCNATYSGLQNLLSQKNLREIQQKQVREKAAARAEKTMVLYKKLEDDRIAAEKAAADALEKKYQDAVEKSKRVADLTALISAYEAFERLDGYKDSKELAQKCRQEAERVKEEKRLHEEQLAAQRAEEELRAKKRKKKIIAIIVAAVLILIIVVFAVTKVFIPNKKYNSAVSLMNDGKFIEAYDSLIALNGYKDSTAKASEIFNQYKIEKIKIAEVGDIVYFGAYEQDNDTSNGKEDVEWIVLAKENGKILVVSNYGLDCQQYDSSHSDVTWEECSLRTWLNDTFMNNAFPVEEQAKIASMNVSADKNPIHSTDPGNATTDKVFLLSINEFEKYFPQGSAKQCKPTKYAVANGAYEKVDSCWWWLRSPGDLKIRAASILIGGGINFNGDYVDVEVNTVRPALWINLE